MTDQKSVDERAAELEASTTDLNNQVKVLEDRVTDLEADIADLRDHVERLVAHVGGGQPYTTPTNVDE